MSEQKTALKPARSFEDIYTIQTARIEELEAENATLRAEVAKMKKEIERLRRTTHCIVCQRNATRMVGKSS